MEFAVGQFTRRGPIGALNKLCPIFKGTLKMLKLLLFIFSLFHSGAGIATVVISFLLTTYYVAIIGWDLYFLFSSFAKEVPWKTCNNSWNTEKCWVKK